MTRMMVQSSQRINHEQICWLCKTEKKMMKVDEITLQRYMVSFLKRSCKCAIWMTLKPRESFLQTPAQPQSRKYNKEIVGLEFILLYKNELLLHAKLLTSAQSKLCRIFTIFKSNRSLIIIGCTHVTFCMPYFISLFVEVLCFILFSLRMLTNLTISKRKIDLRHLS